MRIILILLIIVMVSLLAGAAIAHGDYSKSYDGKSFSCGKKYSKDNYNYVEHKEHRMFWII